MQRALVLSSTQQKHPRGDEAWVQATLRAIETLAAEGHGFVASLGSTPWELALWKIASLRAPVHIICPVARGTSHEQVRAQVCADFGLASDSCCWHLLDSAGTTQRLKDTWLQRDLEAMRAADCVCPVSIRPRGRLEPLVSRARVIDERFRVPFSGRRRRVEFAMPAHEPAHASAWPVQDMLLHFTRACDGPWPGETRAQYFADVAGSTGFYARDGFRTLRRIVQEQRIRASTFRIRGSGATVSWTAAGPAALSLVRWRSRYARYAFEPYAIGLSRDAAWRAGIRPVVYDQGAGGAADVLHQGRGAQGEWEAEQEWRVPGDVDLSRFESAQVCVLAASEEEAASLRPMTRFAVHAFSRRECPR